MLYIQLIGFIAFIFVVISYQKKTREGILATQIISNTLYSAHYYLLNALGGYIITVINLARSFVFILKDKYKWLNNGIILFTFILLFTVCSIYTYQDIYSLLPLLAAIIYTVMLWQGNAEEIRISATINESLWLIYNFHVLSYAGIIGSVVIIITDLIAIIRYRK